LSKVLVDNTLKCQINILSNIFVSFLLSEGKKTCSVFKKCFDWQGPVSLKNFQYAKTNQNIFLSKFGKFQSIQQSVLKIEKGKNPLSKKLQPCFLFGLLHLFGTPE